MKNSLKGKVIILGVTGSIAAYKAADITSRLVKLEAQVFPVMTKEATKLITPLTLQTLSRNPAVFDMWEEGVNWQPNHIDLADRADLMLISPATANIIACFAHGLAPDLLTSIYLATEAPVLIAPAMNSKMYAHPATDKNLSTLRNRPGHKIIDPDSGLLACGYEGIGKLASVDRIIQSVEEVLSS